MQPIFADEISEAVFSLSPETLHPMRRICKKLFAQAALPEQKFPMSETSAIQKQKISYI